MPVQRGMIGSHEVTVLRDTGCSGIVVKQKFVRDTQYTGKFCNILTIDKRLIRAPMAKIEVDTPYLRKEVEAVCLEDAAYDLVIGNVEGARKPDEPEVKCNSTTFNEGIGEILKNTSREDLKRMQNNNPKIK